MFWESQKYVIHLIQVQTIDEGREMKLDSIENIFTWAFPQIQKQEL